MKKLKVATVVGTRPEIIRLSRVMAKLDEHMDHVIIHTGQNYDYELNEIFFEDLGIRRPDHFLGAAGATAAETIGQVITKVDGVLAEVQPEALLVLGDTNSCLAAISAKRRKIPIFHMEAGNRCFDQRVPEETNRKIVDHISDMNLTYSAIAREYLMREGLPPDRVIKTGSPMLEVITHYMPKILQSRIVSELGLVAGSYFVVSAHREENIESNNSFTKLVDILNRLAHEYMLPVIVSTHPRTRKKIERSDLKMHPLIQLHKPMAFSDYINLQQHSKVVLSDSGTITEESSILGFNALNLREAHERPEGMEGGAVMMTGLNSDRVFHGLNVLENDDRSGAYSCVIPDYNISNVSDKVVKIIISYVDYVNRAVWKV